MRMNEIEATRDRLITTAQRLFARHGFRGASVRRITEAAGTNLGAITYHFGSKDALYQAVLIRLIDPLLQRVMAAVSADAPPLDRVERLMRAIFEHMLSNADVPCLMMHQMTMAGEFPAPGRLAQREVRSMLEALIEEGQNDGSIREGDPSLLALSVVAQPIYFALACRPLAEVHGMDLSDSRVRERLVAHAIDFARRALAPGVTNA